MRCTFYKCKFSMTSTYCSSLPALRSHPLNTKQQLPSVCVTRRQSKFFPRAYSTRRDRAGRGWLWEVWKKWEGQCCTTWRHRALQGCSHLHRWTIIAGGALLLAVCGSTSCVSATWRFSCAAHRASEVAYSSSNESPCNPKFFPKLCFISPLWKGRQ